MRMHILILLCALPLVANAQVRVFKTEAKKTIFVGEQVDSSEMVAKFGAPLLYKSYYDDDCYQDDVTTYKYDGCSFTFVGTRLNSFNVTGGGYRVAIHNLYFAQIGGRLSDFTSKIPPQEVVIKKQNDLVILYFKIAGSDVFSDDSLILNCNTKGLITNIGWFSPV